MHDPDVEARALDRGALGQVRHELLTPLTAVIGFSGILLDDEDDRSVVDGMRAALEEIQAGATELAADVNRLLRPDSAAARAGLAALAAQVREGCAGPARGIAASAEALLDAVPSGAAHAVADLRHVATAARRLADLAGEVPEKYAAALAALAGASA
jgi:signal transduction histidine kinase